MKNSNICKVTFFEVDKVSQIEYHIPNKDNISRAKVTSFEADAVLQNEYHIPNKENSGNGHF